MRSTKIPYMTYYMTDRQMDGQTDGQTDGHRQTGGGGGWGRCNISRPRAYCAGGR